MAKIIVPFIIHRAVLASILAAAASMLMFYSDIARHYDLVYRQQSNNLTDIFDFIVVGGGSAGAVVANRLSRHHKVLLLELGGDPNIFSDIPLAGPGFQRMPATDLMYETVPQRNAGFALHNNRFFWPRGYGLGGSSILNSMIYQRGNPNDFDNWANITGNPEWSYKNVLPFFKGLEDYNGAYPSDEFHGKGGAIHVEKIRQNFMADYFLNAAKEKGYYVGDLNSRQTEGFSELDVNMKNGLRWSTFTAYIKPILARINLTIYRYSRVIKVHLDKRRHAYGVSYYRHGKRYFARSRKEIILSAGVIDSPKILLLSGIGPKKDLHSVKIKCRLNLPVGRNLQDHLYAINYILFDNANSIVIKKIRIMRILFDFATKRRGLLVSNTVSALGFVSTSVRNDTSWPDIQFILNALAPSAMLSAQLEFMFNVRQEVLVKYLSPYYGLDGHWMLQSLVRPKSTGVIKLASRDPFRKPIIQPNYLQHVDDVKALIEGSKKLVDLFENTTAYKQINARLVPTPLPGCDHLIFKSDAYYECLIRHLTFTGFHPVGTVSMGKNLNDSRAVLDSELRVMKASGLRVIDASIMPVITNSNTNIPTIMIGEVGSFFIRRYWAQQYEVCPFGEIEIFYQTQIEKCYYSRLT